MDDAAERPRDPLRRIVLGLLAAAAVLFAYSVVADRFTPVTSTARVAAFVLSMAPEVPGWPAPNEWPGSTLMHGRLHSHV